MVNETMQIKAEFPSFNGTLEQWDTFMLRLLGFLGLHDLQDAFQDFLDGKKTEAQFSDAEKDKFKHCLSAMMLKVTGD